MNELDAVRLHFSPESLVALDVILAFVLFGAASGSHLLPDAAFHAALLVISLSMAVTPLLARIGDRLASRFVETAPPPEALPSERQLSLEAGKLDESFMITTGEDLDIRVVEPVDWDHPVAREPVLQAWMKTTAAVPEQRGLHQALLAYMSDAFLIDVCLIAHGRHFAGAGFQVASLDHALWFHEDFRADDWLLHTVEAERIGGGRGLARGNFYTREGRLVATTMQQGVMRFR